MPQARRKLTVAGFSMLESLLSIFVMSVGLMTVVAVISGSLRFSYDTRDTIVAAELAQEGVELVRNVRDNDFVAGNDGFSSFDNKRHCRIDWNEPSDSLDCTAARGAASRYFLQYAGDVYAHVNGAEERYSRYIYIDYSAAGGNKQAMVRSFVFWDAFSLGDIPMNGDPTDCVTSPSCTYTESLLTAWRETP